MCRANVGSIGAFKTPLHHEVPAARRAHLDDADIEIAHAEHGAIVELTTDDLATGRETFAKTIGNLAKTPLLTDRAGISEHNPKARRSIDQLAVGVTDVDRLETPTMQVTKHASTQQSQVQ
jgi:hypothetical protein